MTLRASVTAEVDPISRIEGHLGVKLSTDGAGYVSGANVHGNLWRGFENFLLGRDANDAITFTQRICGVCPVPHGQTSTYATDAVLGYSRGHITFADDGSRYGVPKKAVLIRNLVLSAEFLMSHLTHFYHLVVLDYVQGPAMPPWTPFFADNYYHTLLRNPAGGHGYTGASTSAGALPTTANGYSKSLWDAGVTQYVKALRIRRLTFEAGALFAGRMPMTSCFVGGGVTNNGEEDLAVRVGKYKDIMEEVGRFIIKEHVPLVLALGALYPAYDNKLNAATASGVGLYDGYNASDPHTFGYGAGVGNFLAWGAFPNPDATGALALPGGVWLGGATGGYVSTSMPLWNKAAIANVFLGDDGSGNDVASNLSESIANSHYEVSSFDTEVYTLDGSAAAFPGVVKRTAPNRGNGYSYIKSPRWNGKACEVGPFARQVVAGFYKVDGTPLATSYGSYYTQYVKNRVFVGDASGGTTGLDPAMIHPDLAVGALRDGLATLTIEFNFYNTVWKSAIETILGSSISDVPAKYEVNADILAALVAVDDSIIGAAYDLDKAVITGLVAEWVIALAGGMSVMDRLRGRALEALYLVQKMIGAYTKATSGLGDTHVNVADHSSWGTGWIDDAALLTQTVGSTWKTPYVASTPVPDANGEIKGYGATEAPRGALAHFCTINASGKIVAYQAVVPTTWNASPKDKAGNNGPIEQAMIGIPFQDYGASFTNRAGATTNTQAGLEALRVAHTFDPCIACAVH